MDINDIRFHEKREQPGESEDKIIALIQVSLICILMTFTRLLKMKWSVKDISLVLILIFIIARVTVLLWGSPFYTTPTDKIFNILVAYGVGLAILVSAYYRPLFPGPSDTVREHDWLIIINYIVWIILWELLDLTDAHAHPGLHYFLMLVGILIITLLWFGPSDITI